MLNANAADHAKIVSRVKSLLDFYAFVEFEDEKGAVSDGIIPHVYVRLRDFYESCQLSSLPRRFFHEEVNDVLSGIALCRKIGIWVFTEVGDGYSVFVYLGACKDQAGMQGIIEEQSKAGKAVLASCVNVKSERPKK